MRDSMEQMPYGHEHKRLQPLKVTEVMGPEKAASMNRAQRRVFGQGRHVKGTGRAPRRTGQPEWFQRMKWDAEQKRLLGKLPVSQLAVHGICSAKQAEALRGAGFKTVWDVVSAEYKNLLKVPTFGPKTLAKFRQDAKIKGQLDMLWTVCVGG